MKNNTIYSLFCFCLLVAGLKGFATVNDGLIGYWPLNGDALDYSGNDNHGTVLEGATFVQNPKGANHVLQTQKGDVGFGHVQVGLPASYHPGTEVVGYQGSGACWVMFDDRIGRITEENWNPVLGHAPGLLYLSRNMGNNSAWTMIRRIENTGTNKNYWPSSEVGSTQGERVWYHIAWTFHSHNAGDPEGHFRWYINGVLSAGFTNGAQTIGTSNFRIGADHTGRSVNIKMAEVRLYDRILTATEIEELSAQAEFSTQPSYPAWWGIPAEASYEAVYEHGVPEADHAPVLVGQLKYLAAKGRDELNLVLGPVGGAGSAINAMVDDFSTNDPSDYAPANIGQLKHITSKFYDRFVAVGFNSASAGWPAGMLLSGQTGYPWQEYVAPENHALANIGQAKFLFAWDLSAWAGLDSSGDGVPDYIGALWAGVPEAWKENIINSPNSSFYDPDGLIMTTADLHPLGDYDGDGRSNLQEYLDGTDPADYFNGEGASALLTLWWGDEQSISPESWAIKTLYVKVTDAEGNAYVNAPVRFAVVDGHPGLSPRRGDSGRLASELLMRSFPSGAVTAGYLASATLGQNTVTAALPTGQAVTFTLHTVSVAEADRIPPFDFRRKDNGDGTVTFTWRASGVQPTDEFHIRKEEPFRSGNWVVKYSITYSQLAPPTDSNRYSLTLDLNNDFVSTP